MRPFPRLLSLGWCKINAVPCTGRPPSSVTPRVGIEVSIISSQMRTTRLSRVRAKAIFHYVFLCPLKGTQTLLFWAICIPSHNVIQLAEDRFPAAMSPAAPRLDQRCTLVFVVAGPGPHPDGRHPLCCTE
ncbi:hypothetical protein N657DRAFT_195066 [Parathielavia appendiculata]|uniref:Uncharacterized protein n=1 Tax=Parathielavia appendiculata TaxID=2587402 RepID=A0AAN6Z6S4_9PEZI|nr:hypothetical protein N657DRAFT_195066 [Parathielavia appendiculata]